MYVLEVEITPCQDGGLSKFYPFLLLIIWILVREVLPLYYIH